MFILYSINKNYKNQHIFMIFYNFILTVIYRLGDSVQVFQVRLADVYLWRNTYLWTHKGLRFMCVHYSPAYPPEAYQHMITLVYHKLRQMGYFSAYIFPKMD